MQYFAPPAGGQPLLAGVQAGKIGCWDVSTGKVLWRAEVGDAGCLDLVFAGTLEGSAVLVMATRRGITIWDAVTGRCLRSPLPGGIDDSPWGGEIQSLGVGRLPGKGSFIAGASYYCDVLRWDTETGDPIGRPLRGHKYSISDVSVIELPDGRVNIISSSEDETICRWDADSGRLIGKPITADIDAGKIASISLPDGQLIIAGCDNGQPVYCWDAETGRIINKPIVLGDLKTWISSIELVMVEGRPRLIVSPSGSRARQWDIFSGEELDPLNGDHFVVFQNGLGTPSSGIWPSVDRVYIGSIEEVMRLRKSSSESSIVLQEL